MTLVPTDDAVTLSALAGSGATRTRTQLCHVDSFLGALIEFREICVAQEHARKFMPA